MKIRPPLARTVADVKNKTAPLEPGMRRVVGKDGRLVDVPVSQLEASFVGQSSRAGFRGRGGGGFASRAGSSRGGYGRHGYISPRGQSSFPGGSRLFNDDGLSFDNFDDDGDVRRDFAEIEDGYGMFVLFKTLRGVPIKADLRDNSMFDGESAPMAQRLKVREREFLPVMYKKEFLSLKVLKRGTKEEIAREYSELYANFQTQYDSQSQENEERNIDQLVNVDDNDEMNSHHAEGAMQLADDGSNGFEDNDDFEADEDHDLYQKQQEVRKNAMLYGRLPLLAKPTETKRNGQLIDLILTPRVGKPFSAVKGIHIDAKYNTPELQQKAYLYALQKRLYYKEVAGEFLFHHCHGKERTKHFAPASVDELLRKCLVLRFPGHFILEDKRCFNNVFYTVSMLGSSLIGQERIAAAKRKSLEEGQRPDLDRSAVVEWIRGASKEDVRVVAEAVKTRLEED